MAGLGRRTFAAGEVLTASNVMGYLQDQAVMNFAGTAARGSAIGSAVSEGMVSYLADSNAVEVYKTAGTAIAGWEPVNLSQSPNAVINGAFDIWQRGTSFSGNVYTADRWIMGNSPSAVSRSTDVPNGFTYSLDITGSNHLLNYRIESVNSTPLYGKSITVSFYAKSSSGSNTMTVAIGTPSATDNFATQNIEYTSSAITITSSWARYSVTFSALSSSITKGAFIYIYRNGATGTDRTLITGVQLEAGSTATPFRRNANSIQGELAACQRYYWRAVAESSYAYYGMANAYATNSAMAWVQHPVIMRTIATSVEWTGTGSNYMLNNGLNGYQLTSFALNAGDSSSRMTAIAVTATGPAAGSFWRFMSNGSTTAYVGISAEL